MATVYCIGRNYAEHAREMGATPAPTEEPMVFLKPEAAVLTPGTPICLLSPNDEIHHETEIVLRIAAGPRIEAVALGLDLTDRARQARAREAGLPWARAKGFRGSAPIGPFVPAANVPGLERATFTLKVNGQLRQRGDVRRMLHPIPRLLAYLDSAFGLRPGDLIFTGTPEGVAAIRSGDKLELELDGVPAAWQVA